VEAAVYNCLFFLPYQKVPWLNHGRTRDGCCVWFNHMVNYGKTVWSTMVDHMVEPLNHTQKHGSTMVLFGRVVILDIY